MSIPQAAAQQENAEEDVSQIQPIGYDEEASSVNARVSSANGFCVIRTDNIELFQDKLTLRLNFFEPVFYTGVNFILIIVYNRAVTDIQRDFIYLIPICFDRDGMHDN